MNQNQKLFVRISQAGEVTDMVEVLDFRGALKVIYESFDSHPARKVRMVIELANQPFPLGNTSLTHAQQVEQQIMSQVLTDKAEIIYPPDVTLAEVEEAFASSEGQLMFMFQKPENRMGVDADRLEAIKHRYEVAFPRVAPHAPKWPTT